jgi:hypothetical protein
MLMRSGNAIDWESIARGMVDMTSEFELTELTTTASKGYQFIDRKGLKAVVIDSTTALGQAVFSGCTGLESVVFPSNLQNIQFQAFANCGSLTKLTIPASVTTIGQYAFNACRGLVSVILEPTTPPTISNGSFNNTTCSFYVPDESLEAYKAANNWSALADRIFPISELNT